MLKNGIASSIEPVIIYATAALESAQQVDNHHEERSD